MKKSFSEILNCGLGLGSGFHQVLRPWNYLIDSKDLLFTLSPTTFNKVYRLLVSHKTDRLVDKLKCICGGRVDNYGTKDSLTSYYSSDYLSSGSVSYYSHYVILGGFGSYLDGLIYVLEYDNDSEKLTVGDVDKLIQAVKDPSRSTVDQLKLLAQFDKLRLSEDNIERNKINHKNLVVEDQ